MSICTHVVSRRRNAPGMRHLVAGMAADEQHQFRLVHDLVGRRRGIVSGATNRQAMPRRDHAAAAKRGGDRCGQRLAQRQHLRSGARCRGAGARDDGDPLRRAQFRRGPLDLVIRRRWPVRRHGQLQRRIGDHGLVHHAESRRHSPAARSGRDAPAAASPSSPRATPGASDAAGRPRRRHRPRTSSPSANIGPCGSSW